MKKNFFLFFFSFFFPFLRSKSNGSVISYFSKYMYIEASS